jgi:bifunctional ADP-heptose synthase (sugar kinase/adenylyltransferase)
MYEAAMDHSPALQKLVMEVATRLRERPVSIAVVGDMILDNTIEGEPRGFHPETKVPILGSATSQESIGGAANIATALQKLGCDVSLFGIIGSDLPGRQLENLLDRQKTGSIAAPKAGSR